MKKAVLLFVVFLSLLSPDLFSQNDSLPPLSTDRPTYSIAPVIVPHNTFQIETGFLFQNESTDFSDIKDMYFGQTLFRYGLFNNFELRLSASYRQQTITAKETGLDSTITGVNPISVGLKFKIFDGKGVIPQLGFIADMTLRHIGKAGFHPTYSYPTGRILATNQITKNLSFLYNIGFAYNGESADGFFIWSGALVYTLFNKLSIYVEPFGSFDHNNLPTNNFDAGLTFLIRHNMQIDVSGGTSFTSSSNYANIGFSWRIPR